MSRYHLGIVGAGTSIPNQYDPARGFTRSTGPITLPTATADASRPPGTPPYLKRGSNGAWVTYLQGRLAVTPPDGDFGTKTEAAVKAFQAAKKLGVDGEVGRQTWEALGGGIPGLVPREAIQALGQAVDYARIGWNAAQAAAARDVASRNTYLAAGENYRWVYDLARWKVAIGLASGEVQDWILNLRQALKIADDKMRGVSEGKAPTPSPRRDTPPAPAPTPYVPAPSPAPSPAPYVPAPAPYMPPAPSPPAPSSGISTGIVAACVALGIGGLVYALRR